MGGGVFFIIIGCWEAIFGMGGVFLGWVFSAVGSSRARPELVVVGVVGVV